MGYKTDVHFDKKNITSKLLSSILRVASSIGKFCYHTLSLYCFEFKIVR